MASEIIHSGDRVSIGDPTILSWRALGQLVVVQVGRKLRNSPDSLGIPAASAIVLATLWALAELTGMTGNTIDLSIPPVAVTMQSSGIGKAFCQAPAAGPGAVGQWTTPLYACGTGGITGPTGPLSVAPDTDGRMILETTMGITSIYAVMMANTDSSGVIGASGAEFRDGYAFSPAFVTASGLSITALSRQCETGFAPAPPTIANRTPYGAGQASYAPGTPSVTASGGFVCGGTRIVEGDLDLPD